MGVVFAPKAFDGADDVHVTEPQPVRIRDRHVLPLGPLSGKHAFPKHKFGRWPPPTPPSILTEDIHLALHPGPSLVQQQRQSSVAGWR
jgi:hypothetical protein